MVHLAKGLKCYLFWLFWSTNEHGNTEKYNESNVNEIEIKIQVLATLMWTTIRKLQLL